MTRPPGFVTLSGTEQFPAYLIAGRQYIPFGYFDSHFVTDPATLVLAETNEGAAVAGYRFGGEMVDVSFGAYNGRIDELGDDDTVDSFVGAVVVAPLEGVMLGASYMSNLAGSDSLSEFVTDRDADGAAGDPVADIIGGWSAFVTVEFLERFKIIGEYAGALDEFATGELYDPADIEKRRPAAWNVELGALLTDTVEVAARYGGSSDGGDPVSGEFLLPESEYGGVVNWGIFDCNLAFEYLHAEFEDDSQTDDTFTVQVAIEF
ncbi:MAG: LbtU family siderophore porin [Desulfobacterales bacterium]|nr:LbtU family siderophore porin [Desulfobacterales bacterium]